MTTAVEELCRRQPYAVPPSAVERPPWRRPRFPLAAHKNITTEITLIILNRSCWPAPPSRCSHSTEQCAAKACTPLISPMKSPN